MVTPPNTERSLQLDHRLKSVKAGVEGGPDLGWWGLKQNHGGLLQQLLAMKWRDNRYLQVFVDFYKSNIDTHTDLQLMMIWLTNMATHHQTMGIQDASICFLD